MRPLVSVCIPVYNTESYLEECLESACKQTLKEIEIICVNDGSTDSSLQVLQKFAENDDRIIIINQENQGAACARNVGIQHAKGEYVFYLDSDDYIAQDALEILVNEMQTRQLDLLFFNGTVFGEQGVEKKRIKKEETFFKRIHEYPSEYKGEDLFKLFKDNKDYRASACIQMIKREFLTGQSLWFTEGIMHEDVLYTFKCLLLASRAGYVNIAPYYRRVRPDSVMDLRYPEKLVFSIFSSFICLKEMLTFCQNVEYRKENEEAIFSEVERMIITCRERYAALNEDDKSKDRFLFKALGLTAFNKVLDKSGKVITWFPRKVKGLLKK